VLVSSLLQKEAKAGKKEYKDVVFNEVMASNKRTIKDRYGESSDWFEIYNPTDSDINLKDYSVSDSKYSWKFPGITIHAKAYLLVYASGASTMSGELHTNFRIKSSGEKLTLKNAKSKVIDVFKARAISTDTSLGRKPDGYGEWVKFDEATPGKSNVVEIKKINKIKFSVEYNNSKSKDQDDGAVWIHPDDASKSLVIGSDKDASKVFVYSLDGQLIQAVPIHSRPGNIDVRYNFPFKGSTIDIVVLNQRDEVREYDNKILVFKIDPDLGKIEAIDNGEIYTIENYGSCLYHSIKDNKFYVFVTSKSGDVEQYLISESDGTVDGELVRTWNLGYTEACVVDDESEYVYFSEENKALWKIGANPKDSTDGFPIAQVGDKTGLTADIEGVALYYGKDRQGYIIVSNQTKNDFKVFDRQYPHDLKATFQIDGVKHTDGIDVVNVQLNETFPKGLFLVHEGNISLKAVSWSLIAEENNLLIHTADPRSSRK